MAASGTRSARSKAVPARVVTLERPASRHRLSITARMSATGSTATTDCARRAMAVVK